MQNKIDIFVDIDNTLADTQKAFVNYIEKQSGRLHSLQDLAVELRGDGDNWYDPYARAFVDSAEHQDTVLNIKPFGFTTQALRALATHCSIHIVSSRINNWHEPTYTWLKESGITDLVTSVHLRDATEMSSAFKTRIAKSLNTRYVFDDSPEVAMALADHVDKVYLIQQPWNAATEANHPNIIRCDDFAGAAKLFIDEYCAQEAQ